MAFHVALVVAGEGASASVRIDSGASGRGLSLTLAPVWGVGQHGERHGAAVGRARCGAARAGEDARTWRAGARWQPVPNVSLDLEGRVARPRTTMLPSTG